MKDYKLLFFFILLILNGCVRGQDDQMDGSVETETVQTQSIEPDDVENVEEIAPETIPSVRGAPPIPIPADVEITNTAETAVQKENFVDYTNWDSLTSRYAPQQQSQRGGIPYVITEARLKEIRSKFMYWFFDMGGNSDNEGDFQKAIQSSTQTIHKNLNFQLPFFGFRFNYTRVSLNGYLEFSDPPENYGGYPLVFPVKDWPKKNDPSFIGIFLSKCRIGSIRAEDVDQRKPGVYFRMERDLQFRTDQFGVEFRERLTWDIREGVVGADSFAPKHAVIVTWKNVTFAGGISQSLFSTNTFQIVLATDEVFTYCIFNYLDIQWTAHTEAGGDTLKGEGGIPAFVGFNAGNGTRNFEYLPYSQGPTLRDLTGRGWTNGFPGRHIFRIDENILTGNCNKDIDGANLPLVFAPESGNMLGGTVVNITGPCFEPSDKVICKFDVADEVFGIVVDRNRAICIQPMLFVEGYVRLEIAVGNEQFKWKGKYFVETPGTATEKIFFVDNAIGDINPPEIKIKWVKQNLTTNDNAPIRISLWGYRETTIRPEFLYIDLLADGITNNGEYTISPAAYRNRNNRIVSDMVFGFIQINLTDAITVENADRTVTPLIWSRPIPLAWYFGPQWENEFGTRWPRTMCDQWIKNDRYLKSFAHELPQCPCTLKHALNDKGRFLPDFNCDKDSNPRCDYNRGSMHCVKSGSPTLDGSEQQCCYDKNNYLMLSYDQQWGSFPRRSHNLGYLPWNEANKVPTLSHWFHDIVPRYLCCFWQSEQAVGCETLRFERRPSQDCVSYQAPSIAGVFGDPHVITFDNLAYTFNGKGEFVLVRTKTDDNKLDIQGRFEQMSMSEYGEVRATQLTSIAARGNSSTVVEVRARPEEARWRYRLDVLVDGKRVYFDRPSLKFQHFSGVTVYTPTYILNQSEVILMFDSGAGVEVVENRGYMTSRVYLPWNFINRTRGLFGNWSFDMTDDFQTPDGSLTAITTNLNDFERIYTDFGMKWILEDREDPNVGGALFHREFGRTSATYNNRTFRPEFKTDLITLVPENRSIHRDLAYQYCHDNYHCQYDYAMTLNSHVAHFSLNYYSSIINMKQVSDERTVTCGILPTPRFGRKSNFLFIPGTTVMFECDQNFVLDGDQRRECLARGEWDVPIYGYTECLRQQEYSARQAGITSAIVLAVIITLILCIGYLVHITYKRISKKGNESTWLYGPPSRSASRMKIDEIGTDNQLPTTPLSDDDFTYKSPVNSERSSTSSTTPKKRRSYDKSYRTHEPLEGLPEVDFDEKPWDLDSSNLSEYEPINNKLSELNRNSGPEYSEPFSFSRQVTQSPSQNSPTINSNQSPLESPEYTIIDKNRKREPEKERLQSQSSIITTV